MSVKVMIGMPTAGRVRLQAMATLQEMIASTREASEDARSAPQLNPTSLDDAGGAGCRCFAHPVVLDGWPSGLRRTIGNRVGSRPRGFESHPVRNGFFEALGC